MDVFGVKIPDKPLTNFDLEGYVRVLQIPNFRAVFMRDVLPDQPRKHECGISLIYQLLVPNCIVL